LLYVGVKLGLSH